MLELDEKVATLHFLALNVELIVLAQKQASSTRVKVEDRFLRAGHGNEDAPSGNGVLLYVLPGLAILFPVHLSFIILPTSRFEVHVLHPIAPFVFLKLSNREQMRGCSNSGLRCLAPLRVHVFTEFAHTDAWNYAKAPSSHRGAEERWRCLRLLVASFGSIHQILSLGPLCSDSPVSSRPQPLGSVGDDTPCEDTREDVGLSVKLPATCCRVALMCRCQACNRTAVALVATGPRQVAL